MDFLPFLSRNLDFSKTFFGGHAGIGEEILIISAYLCCNNH